MTQQQRLYWSLNQPLRYMGFSLDEWGVALLGVMPGLYFVNDEGTVLGLLLITLGVLGTMVLRKFKKLSQHFLLKSYLLASGLYPVPSKGYPMMLHQKVGK